MTPFACDRKTPKRSLFFKTLIFQGIAFGLLIAGFSFTEEPWIRYPLTGLVLVTTGVFFYRLFLPLRHIQAGIQFFLHGEWSVRVHHTGHDELGTIATDLNQLARQCEAASRSLPKAESKPEEATAEETFLLELGHGLSHNPNIGVFLCDFESRILFANQTAGRLLNRPVEDLRGASFLRLYPPDAMRLTRRFRSESFTETHALRYETFFLRSDGVKIPVEVASHVLDFEKERVLYLVQNIAKRKEIEERLRESEEEFRSFMETASDLMFITDRTGRLRYVNRAMIQTLGYPYEVLIGKPLDDLFFEPSCLGNPADVASLVTEGGTFHELAWKTRDGRRIEGELKAGGIYLETGEFEGIRGVFRDVTERKKIAESQRLAQLGRLLAGVAHEIKNQITGIQGLTELAIEGLISETERCENDRLILEQANQLDHFVRRLLVFARPGEGERKPGSLNEVVRFVLRLTEKPFLKHRIRIRCVLEEDLPPVLMDEKAMAEVLMNLLQNAFDAIQPPGEIWIRTYRERGEVAVSVEDTGIGISPDVMDRLFEPFFTTKENGTGLGLSICYRIVEAHHGSLRFSSEPGKGTQALLTLPLKKRSNELT